MAFAGKCRRHGPRPGHPGESRPAEQIGQLRPLFGRADEARRLQVALLPAQHGDQLPSGQALDQHIAVQGGQLQSPVPAQGHRAAPAPEKLRIPPGVVYYMLQPRLIGVEGALARGPNGLDRHGRPLQTGQKFPAEPGRLFHILQSR